MVKIKTIKYGTKSKSKIKFNQSIGELTELYILA